jgi:hypothetical protein
MALPVILIDSATGSDTLCSGAGPGTALTGSAAATDGAGTLVTLDGSPDLSGVAVDGSHVIFLADTTAGARNYGKITAKDDGAKTVTVANAFGISLSGKSWAIGGKLASIGTTNPAKLVNNNSANGDAMPGWVMEFQSGHAETIAATLSVYRAGDTTSGPITLRGLDGAAVRPILTFSNNGVAISFLQAYGAVRDFDLKNSNATKTASVGVQTVTFGSNYQIRGMRINTSASKFWKGILLNRGNAFLIEYCHIAYCAGIGIEGQRDDGDATGVIRYNIVTDCTLNGMELGLFNFWGGVTYGNIVARCAIGILLNSGAVPNFVCHNTLDTNTSDGLKASYGAAGVLVVTNNIFSNNTGYGWNQTTGTEVTRAASAAPMPSHNCFYNNTAGTVPATRVYGENNVTTNPAYTNAAGNDFTPGVNMKGLGAPSVAVGSTTSTVDIGAAQRLESGLKTHPGMAGGMRG